MDSISEGSEILATLSRKRRTMSQAGSADTRVGREEL